MKVVMNDRTRTGSLHVAAALAVWCCVSALTGSCKLLHPCPAVQG